MLPRPKSLSIRLALASIVSAAAVAVVCGAALVSMRGVSSYTATVVARHLATMNDTSAFEALLYHRGFAAEYMLTGDRRLLAPLAVSRGTFEGWLARARESVRREEALHLLAQIEHAHTRYQKTRSEGIVRFDAGDRASAGKLLLATHGHIEEILQLFRRFNALGRRDAEGTLADAERSTHRLGWVIAVTSLFAVLASLVTGTFLAQRVVRPIYELQLQVASAAERMRFEVRPGGDLGALASDVATIVRRLEDMDAALVEQRRRLIQSEKLSAVGELAAKLAHEILNPLTGMKTAAQVLARSAQARSVEVAAVRETAEALDREIGRVNDLVRRLVDFSRPLAPRLEPVPVARLLAQATEASAHELRRRGVTVKVEEETGLPAIAVDPLLCTQAVSNLLCNAAQASVEGGVVTLSARRAPAHGRDGVSLEVADEGSGIAPQVERVLFHPFVTTREKGHGLGLAVSQNIVLEHGGRISGRNREGAPGAIFEIWLPVGGQV